MANTVTLGRAGQSLTTGNDNTLLGNYAGEGITSGTGSIMVGYKAGFSDGNVNGVFRLGEDYLQGLMISGTKSFSPSTTSEVSLGGPSLAWTDFYQSGTAFTDTILEFSTGSGVSVEGVIMSNNDARADSITELTSGSGVVLNGLLLSSSGVNTDYLYENSSGSGVTITDLLINSGTGINTNILGEVNTGSGIITNALLPAVDGTFSLGTETSKWNFLYIDSYIEMDKLAAAPTGMATNSARWFIDGSSNTPQVIVDTGGTEIIYDLTANDGASLQIATTGTGSALTIGRNGATFEFKSISAGTNISFGITGNNIEISSTGGGGTGTTTFLESFGPGGFTTSTIPQFALVTIWAAGGGGSGEDNTTGNGGGSAACTQASGWQFVNMTAGTFGGTVGSGGAASTGGNGSAGTDTTVTFPDATSTINFRGGGAGNTTDAGDGGDLIIGEITINAPNGTLGDPAGATNVGALWTGGAGSSGGSSGFFTSNVAGYKWASANGDGGPGAPSAFGGIGSRPAGSGTLARDAQFPGEGGAGSDAAGNSGAGGDGIFVIKWEV